MRTAQYQGWHTSCCQAHVCHCACDALGADARRFSITYPHGYAALVLRKHNENRIGNPFFGLGCREELLALLVFNVDEIGPIQHLSFMDIDRTKPLKRGYLHTRRGDA